MSPPESSYNSPLLPIPALSALNLGALSPPQSVKPLPDSTQCSGDMVEQREQLVLTQEDGGCLGSVHLDLMPNGKFDLMAKSRRSSVTSSLSSLSVSSHDSENPNALKTSLSESSEHKESQNEESENEEPENEESENEELENEESENEDGNSEDSSREEERADPTIVVEETSGVLAGEPDPTIVVKEKSAGGSSGEDSSGEEEDGDCQSSSEDGQSKPKPAKENSQAEEPDPTLVVEEESPAASSGEEDSSGEEEDGDFQSSSEHGQSKPKPATKNSKDLPPNSLDKKQDDAMNVDVDLTVRPASPSGPRRSSRNAARSDKPGLELDTPSKKPKRKSRKTTEIILGNVSVPIFSYAQTKSMSLSLILRSKHLSSQMWAKQRFVFAFLHVILK